MADFLSIIKIEFLGLFGINKALKANDSKQKRKLVTFMVFSLLATAMLIFLAVLMCVAFGDVYWEMGGEKSLRNLPSLMYTMTVILILVMGLHNVRGVLFGFKDYQLLMSMPIKNSAIISAKLCFMYIVDLAATMTLLIPSYILYGWFMDAGVVFYLVNSLLLFVLPLIPLALALVVGTIITFLTARMRGQNILEIVLSLAFICLLFAMNTLSNKEIANVGAVAAQNPIAWVYIKASCDLNLYAILGIIGVSIVVVAILFLVLERFYKPLNSALMSKHGKSDYVYKEQKSGTVFGALFKREVRRYFSLPIYVLNTLSGGIIGLIMPFMMFSNGIKLQTDGQTILQALDSMSLATGSFKTIAILFVAMPILVASISATMPTTTPSISLEGKTFWILKSAPIGTKSVITSKLLLDYMIFLPFVALSEIVLGVAIKLPYYAVISFVLIGLFMVLFSGALGLYINICQPVFDWENQSKPIKQSIAAVYTLLINGAATLLLIGTCFAVYTYVGYLVAMIVVAVVALILAVISIILLYTRGIKKYNLISD